MRSAVEPKLRRDDVWARRLSAGKVLAVPKNLREPWSERVAIMVTDGGQAREEAARLAWEWFQAPGEAR